MPVHMIIIQSVTDVILVSKSKVVVKGPPHLKHDTTLPCNLSLITIMFHGVTGLLT